MKEYENVECGRCGNQWYSKEFEEEKQLPEKCPYCYQESVRKIPEPPTKLDIFKKRISKKREEIPKRISEKRHQIHLFIENNRMLISLANMGLIITLLVAVLVYVLFYM